MKTKIATALLFVVLIATSCKKETTTPSTPSTPAQPATVSIVGTWNWTTLSQGNGTMTTYTVPANKTLTFVSDGTYSSNFNYIEIGYPAAVNSDNGTYTNTDSLRLTSSVTGKKMTAKVNKLTANDLWIFYRAGSLNDDVHFAR